MSIEKGRAYFRALGIEDRVQEFTVSSATVELAAQALGVEGARIAKTLSFKTEDGCMLILAAGDARIDNRKFKDKFHMKAKMLSADEVLELVGHPVGGVCPFGINEGIPVYLDESEQEKYEGLKKDLILATPEHEVTAANAASLVNKLSQMANGAVYTDDEDIITFHDKKLDALEDIIESANGKPLLVAYWFKHDYTRIVERLNKIGVKYMKIDSDESITKWNNREIPVALIHPASAGHGLNLQQGGNTMVWFGITWSLELYQQCVCRLYRQGQSEGTVTIIHLISQGTIDEKIMKLQYIMPDLVGKSGILDMREYNEDTKAYSFEQD